MSRRKKDVFDFIGAFIPLYVLVLFYWWFFNKSAFWKWLSYGIGFVLLIIAFGIWRRKAKFKQIKGFLSDRDLLLKLRSMSPSEFEEYIAALFSKLGFKTKVAGGPYDEGIDVIAEKEGVKYYIQCKKFITQEVGVGAVRDFYGTIADKIANGKGYFITTNKFTLEAEKFAEDKPIELVDGFKLIKYIRLAEKTSKEARKNCPKCGGKLIEKTGKYGKFLGCLNYPRCKYTEDIKK